MNGFQRFENKLEQAISGAFARAFRSAVQPVEIAAALQRECDNNAQILSRNRRLVAELVPEQGTSMSKGPLYNERLGQFVRDKWDVAAAMALAPSLQRTVGRLKHFLE